MVTTTAATTNGATPVEAVRWMLRKQLMVLDSMINLQHQLQVEATAWKQEHSELVGWEDPANEWAYRHCFERMDQPEWLGIDGSLEARHAELMFISSALDEGDYMTVADFLYKEHQTLCVEIAAGRSVPIPSRLSADAFMALAVELVLLTYR